MAHEKFTKADDITVLQSVGPKTGGDVNVSNILDVFQPHQGRDLIYKNPKFNNGSTEITQNNDRRIPLGTYTLNNRDYWENNNFNEATFQPYLTEEYAYRKSYKLETWGSTRTNTIDGSITLPSIDGGIGNYDESNTSKFSIDALPFVINPNNDDIIHLDRYYDKEIDKENYELATEGKINLKLEVKVYGRVPPENIPTWPSSSIGPDGEQIPGTAYAKTYGDLGYLRNFGMNIDIFSNRYLLTSYIDNSVEYKAENDGIYLFKLNWDDGTELEHTSEPKLLEDTVLFEHHYEKPGFYSITGVVYRVQDGQLKTWEKFKTNILLNPSVNYELNLHDYSNFASIGGIDKNSAFVKSLYNIVGINPLTRDPARASEEVIEKLNTLDKIQILNVLGKVDYSRLNDSLLSIVSPYQGEIDGVDSAILGCTDIEATNYSGPLANIDDGSCVYTRTATISIDGIPPLTDQDYINIKINEETLSFQVTDTPQYVEFDRRDNLTITLTNQLQDGLEFPNELTTIEDWFFVGWTFNGVDMSPITAHPNILYEGYTVPDIADDFTLNARFQYIDETPPLNANDLTTYNHDSDPAPYPTGPDYGQVGLLFYPSMSDDVDHYEIELFYTSLEVPTVVFSTTKTKAQVGSGLKITTSVSNQLVDYTFKVTTYDTSENFSSINSGTIRPIIDWTVAPEPLTGLSVEQIDRNILRFTWDQIDLSWPGIDGDFGHFELVIWNDNGEEYTYEKSGYYDNENYIMPNSFDFDASEIGSLFRYLGGGVIINSQSDMDNVNPDNPLSWDARIRVVDGDYVASGPTEMNSIQPSRLIDPFGTVKLSISVNGAHGTISVNDPDEIEPWGAYTILLTPFLNHDIIVSSEIGWLFGDIVPFANEDDDFTDYIVYDENLTTQTISISDSFSESPVWTQADYNDALFAASAGNFMTGYPMIYPGAGAPYPDESAIGTLNPNLDILMSDKEGTLRVNWIELDAQSLISFPNNNSDPLVFDGYFIEPYVLGEPNEKVEIPFTWDLSLLYNPDGTGHIAAGDELQVRLTYIYDWNPLTPGLDDWLAQMFGGEDSIITIDWDENNLSGTSTMVVNYVEDGDDLLESFVNPMSLTMSNIYPEAYRLAFWKTNSEGMMGPFGTTGTLDGPTVYGSPEIQFNRATLGCTDDTALNYNPNASGSDGSCSYLADFQTVSYETTSTDVVVPSNGNDTYPLFNLTRDSGEGTLSLWYTVGSHHDGSPPEGLTGDYDGGSAAWGTDFYLSSGGDANWPGTNAIGYVTFNPGVLTRTLRLRILGTNSSGVPDRTDSDTIYLHLDGVSNSEDIPVMITGTTPAGLQDTVKHVVNILPPVEQNTYTLTITETDYGTTSPTMGSTTEHLEGTYESLSAFPSDGYDFHMWYGASGAIGDVTSRFTTIQMNSNKEIFANFLPAGSNVCFIAGTQITMADESTKNIEDIEIGDIVKSWNEDINKIENDTVVKLIRPIHDDIVKLTFDDVVNGNTFDHPYYVRDKGWSSYKPEWTMERYDIGQIGQLEVGDVCYQNNDGELEEIKLSHIKEELGEVQTYIFKVKTNNTFFANSILTHNK